MAANEAQYLAILQNGAYPIPVPAHLGVAPIYRGTHPQPLPLLNGSFFSSHLVQPSHLQQQQLTAQSHSQHGQNPSISTGYTSTQKHLQNQQQRPHSNGINNGSGNGNLQGYPAVKSQQSQSLANKQQKQHSQNQKIPHQPRQLDCEVASEDSPSTADSQVSRAGMNFYGQNFPMTIHQPNFALLTTGTMAGPSVTTGNANEKKQQQIQLQVSKAGVESLPSQAATAGSTLESSSIANNHALSQNLSEATRHGYHLMATGVAVQAAQQSKNFCVSDGRNGGNDSSSMEKERKLAGGKASSTVHSTMQSQHATAVTSVAQSKVTTTKNGSVYPDNLSSVAAKFPNALSAFPQSLIQNNNPGQLEWKNSVRSPTSQVPSPSLASTPPNLKSTSQQQGRLQQGHTQISFAGNSKPSATIQGQVFTSNNQPPSSPMVVGSPTTSSISKGAGGSPRTTSSSASYKGGHSSAQSSQQAKSHSSVPAQKSSPAGGRNISSILGHPHISNSPSSNSTRPQSLPQHQLQKHALQQAHMLFTMQNQSQHGASSANTAPVAAGFYLQRHRSEQDASPMSTSSISQVTQAATTTDPAKAVAAATAAANNMKGGSLTYAPFSVMQSSGKQHQPVPPDITYMHAIPSAVQVKPAEQKQPAGGK